MKIWYDKSKLDLNNFKQEKFLFLPLFDKKVIDRDYNFKNNKWIETINEHVEYTSIEDADYLVYHDKFDNGISDFIKTTQSFDHKPILAFYNDDDSRPISKKLPNNLHIFRTSIDKQFQRSNEHALPAWSADLLGDRNNISIRDKMSKPVISFCGALTHPSRSHAINILAKNDKIETSFIIRNSFWGGSIHDPILREEYINNMRESDIVLCCRGAGNFSFRLYECMSLGKIPLIIDTDLALPCSDEIDWEKTSIITQGDGINNAVNTFWEHMQPTYYEKLQNHIRHLYNSLINPAGFTSYISKCKIN